MIFVKTTPTDPGAVTPKPDFIPVAATGDVLWRHGGLYCYFDLETVHSAIGFVAATRANSAVHDPIERIHLHWDQGRRMTADEVIELLANKLLDE